MGFFNIFSFNDDDNKNKKNERLEKEIEWNNLDEYEKEEVRKGNYDVHNFEDSDGVDLDEDDYYYLNKK